MNITAHMTRYNALPGQASVCTVGQAASVDLYSGLALLRLLP